MTAKTSERQCGPITFVILINYGRALTLRVSDMHIVLLHLLSYRSGAVRCDMGCSARGCRNEDSHMSHFYFRRAIGVVLSWKLVVRRADSLRITSACRVSSL